MKGHFLYQARRYGEAIDLLRRALELEPAYWVGHITLGKNYERVGRYEDALEAFRRAGEFSASISSELLSLIGYTYLCRFWPAAGGRTRTPQANGDFTRQVRPTVLRGDAASRPWKLNRGHAMAGESLCG
jgi:tetratricopeptide (TPR) repeat protein